MNVLLLSRNNNSLTGVLIGVNYPPCSSPPRGNVNIRRDIDWKDNNTRSRDVRHNRQCQEQNRR